MPTSIRLGAPALVLALLTGTSSALAFRGGDDHPFGEREESPWWVGFSTGITSPVDVDAPAAFGDAIEFKNGYLISGAVGYRLGRLSERVDWGIELEGLFTEADVDEDGLAAGGSASAENVSTAAGLLNGVLNWRWSENVSVTFAAGVGYGVTDFNTFKNLPNKFTLGDNNDGVAAQGKIGLVYDLGGNFDWTLGYRYFRLESLELEDASLGQTFDLTNEIHSFEIGLRYGL